MPLAPWEIDLQTGVKYDGKDDWRFIGPAGPGQMPGTQPTLTPYDTYTGNPDGRRLEPGLADGWYGTKQRTAPTPSVQSAGSAGSGSGGVSGSGSGGGGSINAGQVFDWQKAIADARAAAAAQAAQLDAKYEADREELAALYQLSETDQEKAQIARMLQSIERQRNEGLAAIKSGYSQAETDVLARAAQSREATTGEAQAVSDVFLQMAAAVGADADAGLERAEDVSQFAAVGGGLTSDDMIQAGLISAAPREALLQQRLGDIRTEGIEWMADSLKGESLAKQSDLGRQADLATERANLTHAQMVADRINQERMAYAQALQGLQGDYRARGWDLGDQDVALLTQLAEMQQSSSEAALDRQAEWDMLNRRLAAEQAMNAARIAASRSSSGADGASMGPLEQGVFAANLLGDTNDPKATLEILSNAGLPIPSYLRDKIAEQEQAARMDGWASNIQRWLPVGATLLGALARD